MKTILIGEKPHRLLEDTHEVSARRSLEVELYKLLGYCHGTSAEDVIRKIDELKKAFDIGKLSDCVIFLHEMQQGIIKITNRHNPYHYIFALLVLEENENNTDPSFLSQSFLSEKLQRFYDLGLTEALVEETVVTFLMSSAGNVPSALLKTLQAAPRLN